MEIKVTQKERHTDIDSDDLSDNLHAEFFNDELVLYFYLDDSGLDVAEARRVAEFINIAADELERFKAEAETENAPCSHCGTHCKHDDDCVKVAAGSV